MAIFKITSGTTLAPFTLPSKFIGATAFSSDTPVADTLTVELGAFLISTLSDGATLNNTGNWTVSVAGLVQGQTIGLDVLSTSATISVTEDGAVKGVTDHGIQYTGGGSFTLNNKGIIAGSSTAIAMTSATSTLTNSGDIFGSIVQSTSASNDTLTNSGRITGEVKFLDGTNKITNSGSIFDSVSGGNGADTVANTGFINGRVSLGNGTNILTNGKLASIGVSSLPFTDNLSVEGGANDDKITNDGILSGFVAVNGGTNSLTNTGSIGKSDSGQFSYSAFGTGNDTVVNSLTGQMAGRIDLGNGTNKLTNGGFIGADGANISVNGGSGSDTVSNTKTITGKVALGNGTNSFTNSGVVGGVNAIAYTGGADNDTITNSGTIKGDIELLGAADISATVKGLNLLTNSGRIEGRVFGNINNDKVDNKASVLGGIFGDVLLGGGANTLLNAGFIDGLVVGGTGNDTVTNSGKIIRNINLGDAVDISATVKGLNLLTNSGRIEGNVTGGLHNDKVDNKASASGGIFGDVILGGGANTLLNAGLISGAVTSGSGDDTFTNTGTIGGIVNLGGGDDKYTGGSFVDQVTDGLGKDTIALGGGNDTFIAADSGGVDSALDSIDGGLGIDTYDGSGFQIMRINLGTTNHTAPVGFGFLTPTLVKNQTIGFDDIELVFNFENAIGTSGGDMIIGSSAANVLQGRGGGDDLFGYAGNDKLEGGVGNDLIVGGLGADILTGGFDNDSFFYFNINESGRSALMRDTITDFVVGEDGDVINLSAIDANTLVAGDQAFSFIGTNVVWGGVEGQLRAVWTATGQVVEGDVNGDKISDFSIFIADGGTHAVLSGANDFIL